MKVFTDLEQSKKLAEILPIESADFHFSANQSQQGYLEKPIWGNSEYADYSAFPCWSLTALLGVLPKGTRLLKSATDDTYHCDCPKGNIDRWYDNPVDAAVEMILKRKERAKVVKILSQEVVK